MEEDLEISLNDGILDYSEDGIFLVGKLIINANDINNFYKSFQIRTNRKIEKVELDFFITLTKISLDLIILK